MRTCEHVQWLICNVCGDHAYDSRGRAEAKSCMSPKILSPVTSHGDTSQVVSSMECRAGLSAVRREKAVDGNTKKVKIGSNNTGYFMGTRLMLPPPLKTPCRIIYGAKYPRKGGRKYFGY